MTWLYLLRCGLAFPEVTHNIFKLFQKNEGINQGFILCSIVSLLFKKPFNSYVTPKLTYPTGGSGEQSCSTPPPPPPPDKQL